MTKTDEAKKIKELKCATCSQIKQVVETQKVVNKFGVYCEKRFNVSEKVMLEYYKFDCNLCKSYYFLKKLNDEEKEKLQEHDNAVNNSSDVEREVLTLKKKRGRPKKNEQ